MDFQSDLSQADTMSLNGRKNKLDQGLDLKVNRLGTLGWGEGEAKFVVTKYKVVYYVP